MWSRDSFNYYSAIFPLRYHGSFSGSTAWNGIFFGSDDIVCDRYSRNAYIMDFCILSVSQILVFPVYFVPGILAGYDRDAGDLLLLCTEKMSGKSG